MLIDWNFELSYDKEELHKFEIRLINKHRELRVRAKDDFEYKNWIRAFHQVIKESKMGPCNKIKYDSFAPRREGNDVKYFIDGHNYFDALYTELCKARKEVFI